MATVRDSRLIMNKKTGRGLTGYTLKAMVPAGSSSTALHSGTLIGTYTDSGDGTYYLDVTSTVSATLAIVTPNGTTIVRNNVKDIILIGGDQSELPPPST